MGVQTQECLIPAVSRGAVTSQGWRAQRGGPWLRDCNHKQIFFIACAIYMHEMLSQNLPASSVPLIGAFLISKS